MTTRKRKPSAAGDDSPARIRKAYFECRYGQLHVTTAFPVGGGFDEHAPLLCIHRCALSSRAFRPFMEEIGRDRSVYAPDLPGCGESDPPQQQPSIEGYAAALADFLDHMRLRQFDVAGHHTGSLIAAELAIARPDVVRRLMLVGLPILAGEERAAWVRSVAPPAASAEELALTQARDPNVRWMPNAALAYAADERLPLVRQPVLLVRNQDYLWEATLRGKPWLRDVKVLDLPGHGIDAFCTAPRALATRLRAFLDRRKR